MKTKLRQDSRDLHVLDHFSSPIGVPLEFEFDKNLTNPVEKITEVDCTAIAATDVATDQTGTLYDITDLWSKTVHSSTGADARAALNAMITYGLQGYGKINRDTRWVSYMRADGDSGDYFENTILSMWTTQSSTTIASPFYREWENARGDSILPMGENIVTGHDYKVSGVRNTPQGQQFHVKLWTGVFVWMPKDVFNHALDAYGSGAYIPTTKDIEAKKRTLSKFILDNIVNVLILIQRQLLSLKTQPMSNTNFSPMITKWATLVEKNEGANPANNNPGNFKFSTLIASWGATKGSAGSDGGNFAVFPTYQQGFTALCNFLKLGCEDELKAYHQARTIKEFTLVYTNHPQPQYDYSDNLINQLGVTADTNIATFL